jgi:hypothetical protein
MKTILIVSLLIRAGFSFAQAQQQLSPGDIAIIGFNFRDPDEFSFITLADIPAGTQIHFTDCGWKSDNTFRKGEGIVTYTVPAEGKRIYSVITYPADPGFTVTGVNGFFGFSLQGDQILVYQGDFNSPQFIFALNNKGNSWQQEATDNNTSTHPPGLTPGFTSVSLVESQNQIYNCHTEYGDKNTVLASLSDPSNWTGSSTRFSLPRTCFDDALPVIIYEFEIKENEETELCFSFASDGEFLFEILFSAEGREFYSIYQENFQDILSGRMCLKNNDMQNGYYKIKIADIDGKEYFSETKHYKKPGKELIKIQLYTIEGILTGEGYDLSEIREKINVNLKGSVLIKKSIFSDIIKTEKILFE